MAKRAKTRIGERTRAGYVSTVLQQPDTPDYVVAELRYESPVTFTRSRFAAAADAAPQAGALNQVLEKFDVAAVRSHFGLPAEKIRSRVQVARALPRKPVPERFAKKGMDTEFIQSGFVQIVPKRSADARRIATALEFKPQVPRSSRIVYKVPRLAKARSASLSKPEQDLQRYMQVILPAGEPPRAHVDTIATWPFVEEAHVAPEVSLPGSIPSPAPQR